MRSNSNIYIFSAPVQSGKTTLLMNWVNTQQNICGILAPDVDGKRKVFDISTKTYFDFETNNTPQSEELISVGRFHFNKSAFAQAQRILNQSLNLNPEWLIIDEVAKLELYEQKGLEPAVTNVIKHYQQNKTDEKLLLVIRDSLLKECIEHYGLQNATIINKDFFNSENKGELLGLVVCGGQSTRMGTDKCFLNYHGKPQAYHLYEILQQCCEQVFISCNQSQVSKFEAAYQTIVDDPECENIGPMAALMSAFKKYPEKSFLVVGCDYPFITRKDLMKLIVARDKNYFAICYSKDQSISEPLLCVYEKEVYPFLKNKFLQKKYSLRHFLEEVKTARIAGYPEIIKSIDTSQEYQVALKRIKQQTF